jgi:hypothetical protein
MTRTTAFASAPVVPEGAVNRAGNPSWIIQCKSLWEMGRNLSERRREPLVIGGLVAGAMVRCMTKTPWWPGGLDTTCRSRMPGLPDVGSSFPLVGVSTTGSGKS